MITNSDQDILISNLQQLKAVEKFRQDLEQIFREQIAKHELMKEGGFSFPIYTRAPYDGGIYQYSYMTYFSLEFWKCSKKQQEIQIQLQIDTALKKIVSHMISIGCDVETLKPKSTGANLYDTV